MSLSFHDFPFPVRPHSVDDVGFSLVCITLAALGPFHPLVTSADEGSVLAFTTEITWHFVLGGFRILRTHGRSHEKKISNCSAVCRKSDTLPPSHRLSLAPFHDICHNSSCVSRRATKMRSWLARGSRPSIGTGFVRIR